MLFVFVVFNAIMMVVTSHILSPTRQTAEKDQPYESGMPPIGSAHQRFDIKYYLVTVIFIVFDIEVVFMMPWAVAFRQLDLFGLGPLGALIEMAVFVVILAVGYIYVWKRGALEWT
jgi:NADH-quinone oxidoreductase subunit A